MLFVNVSTVPDETVLARFDEKETPSEPSLIPETARVVALAYANAKNERVVVVGDTGRNGEPLDETDLLAGFMKLSRTDRPIIVWTGWNLSVLLVRAAMHGIRTDMMVDQRPWGGDYIEVLRTYKSFGRFGSFGNGSGNVPLSLHWVAKAFGVDVDSEEYLNGIRGADIPALFESGNLDAVRQYTLGRLRLIQKMYTLLETTFVPPISMLGGLPG